MKSRYPSMLLCAGFFAYLEWESFAVKAGLAPMQKRIVRDLLDVASEEELEEIATKAADNLNDTLLMMYGKVDLDAALQFTASRDKRSGFTLRKFEDDANNNDNDYGRRTQGSTDEGRAKQRNVTFLTLGSNHIAQNSYNFCNSKRGAMRRA